LGQTGRRETAFTPAGKSNQRAFIEPFSGKFGEYCVDLNWFAGLSDARSTFEGWRTYYNHVWPHWFLGGKLPAVFAPKVACYAQLPTSNAARVQEYGQ
jgi:putative transposase